MMNKFVSVYNCAACGGTHMHLEFRPVKLAANEVSLAKWHALCPVKGVRIFATDEQAKKGDTK
jgi:hypothetical protein